MNLWILAKEWKHDHFIFQAILAEEWKHHHNSTLQSLSDINVFDVPDVSVFDVSDISVFDVPDISVFDVPDLSVFDVAVIPGIIVGLAVGLYTDGYGNDSLWVQRNTLQYNSAVLILKKHHPDITVLVDCTKNPSYLP